MSSVRVVAANCSLGTQLNASEPDQTYAFFSATTAATFTQLNADLLQAIGNHLRRAHDRGSKHLIAFRRDRREAVFLARRAAGPTGYYVRV